MADNKQSAQIIDNPAVGEAYATKLVTTWFEGGIISVTLGAVRFVPKRIDDKPGPGDAAEIHITSRLALTPACAVELLKALNHTLGVVAAQAKQKAAPKEPKTPAAGRLSS